jgi:glycine C-acetyltransferase
MYRILREAGFDIGSTKSQVVPVMVGSDHKLREISRRMFKKGLYTGFVTYPAVSRKQTRLRLSVSSLHTKEKMERCVEILQEVFSEAAESDFPANASS